MSIETHVAAIRNLIERDRTLAESDVLSPERHEASTRSMLDHIAAIERELVPPPVVVGTDIIVSRGRIGGGHRPNLPGDAPAPVARHLSLVAGRDMQEVQP